MVGSRRQLDNLSTGVSLLLPRDDIVPPSARASAVAVLDVHACRRMQPLRRRRLPPSSHIRTPCLAELFTSRVNLRASAGAATRLRNRVKPKRNNTTSSATHSMLVQYYFACWRHQHFFGPGAAPGFPHSGPREWSDHLPHLNGSQLAGLDYVRVLPSLHASRSAGGRPAGRGVHRAH